MKNYTCVVDIPEVGNAGDVVSLDSEALSTRFLADEGKIRAVEESQDAQLGSPENPMSEEQACAAGIDVDKVKDEAEVLSDAPATEAVKAHFSLIINWREGTTESEQEAALAWIKESSAQISASPEDLFPLCVDSFEVKRNR